MAIDITCPCGGQFKARDEHAGRKVQCPRCEQILVVPQPRVEQDSSIDVACSCGGQFKVRGEHAGRKAKCPRCEQILVIPQPGVEPSVEPEVSSFAGFFDEAFSEPSPTSSSDQAPFQHEADPYGSDAYGSDAYDSDPDSTETSRGIKLTIEVACKIRQEAAVRKIVRETMMQHLAVGQEVFNGGSLIVTVTDWKTMSGKLCISVSCGGKLNGRRVRCRASRDGTASLNYKERLISQIIVQPISSIFYQNTLSSSVRHQAESCVDDLCVALDREAGLKGNTLSFAWYSWLYISLLGIAITVGLLLGFSVANPIGNNTQTVRGTFAIALIGGGVVTYCVTLGIVLTLMPNRFFLRDPRGRRIMRRFYTKTPLQFRILLPLIMMGIATFAYLFFQHLNSVLKGW